MVRAGDGARAALCVLERIELERAGPSYTLDTVRALQAAEPGAEWVLIIGQDQYAGLHTWHGWQELLGTRGTGRGQPPRRNPPAAPRGARAPAPMVPLPMLDISATEVRRAWPPGQDITDLVPPAVARYIDQHRLYLGTAEGGPHHHRS
jgi:nicotinate-nucleotide adenylyltransferase